MKLSQSEKEVWYSYHLSGCTNLHRVKVNAIFFNVKNTKEHELKKAEVAYDLMKNKEKIITEGVDNKSGLRRDLISLSTGEVYEIENSKTKRGHRHPKEINVIYYDT